MVSVGKRIAIATVVSVLGCIGTYFWHLKTAPRGSNESDADVIAFIASTKNEIHRKGANNTLWEPAETRDRLRAGDSVRTSGAAEARIQFYGSDRYIDLEPESMIAIQKQQSEISLELLEGSLFVNGVDKNSDQALTLKSQGGKVDLSKSAAQLSGSSSSQMDLKVLKGSAQVLNSNGKAIAIQEGKAGGIGTSGVAVAPEKVKIQSPDLTKPFYVNALKPEPVLIAWTGLPSNAQIILESGPSRKKLTPFESEKVSTNQIRAQWKTGTHYWRLKALSDDGKTVLTQSDTFKTEIIGRFPPTPVSPEPNFNLQTRKQNENLTLRWNAPAEFKEVLVEFKNETTKEIILNKRFPASQDSHDIPNLGLGNYSWRITGYPEDGGQPLSGPFLPISISQKRIIKIPLTWNANLKPTQYFVNSDPKLTLMWEAGDTDRVQKFKIHLTPEGTPLEKAETFESRQLLFEKVVSKPGRYLSFVEAFDEEGDKIGSTEVRTFDVEMLPLLTAPALQPDNIKEFLARPDGSLSVQWESVTGAKDYEVVVLNQEGKKIGDFSTEATFYNLTNLMPGEYSLQILATDQYGRKGNLSSKRSLIVPDKSEVQAPKLKKIKVN